MSLAIASLVNIVANSAACVLGVPTNARVVLKKRNTTYAVSYYNLVLQKKKSAGRAFWLLNGISVQHSTWLVHASDASHLRAPPQNAQHVLGQRNNKFDGECLTLRLLSQIVPA